MQTVKVFGIKLTPPPLTPTPPKKENELFCICISLSGCTHMESDLYSYCNHIESEYLLTFQFCLHTLVKTAFTARFELSASKKWANLYGRPAK